MSDNDSEIQNKIEVSQIFSKILFNKFKEASFETYDSYYVDPLPIMTGLTSFYICAVQFCLIKSNRNKEQAIGLINSLLGWMERDFKEMEISWEDNNE